MTELLINCDLGEWESPELARSLIAEVDLINIACGGHAGSPEQITFCKNTAEKFGVASGAHPGTSGNKGRFTGNISVDDFEKLLNEQIRSFEQHAGTPAHLKLHGSLYHLSEQVPEIRNSYLNFCEERSFLIIALHEGSVIQEARKRGLAVLTEAFLDRNTLADGQLVPRDAPNALITTASEILARLPDIQADTACLHSDSPHSLGIARSVKSALKRNSRS